MHSGEVGTPRQDDKYRFLDRMLVRLPELAQHSDHVLIVGDLNVGHTELDIKNWKANQKRAGFLPEERAYFDKFFGEIGYEDVARKLAGEVPGPYTWGPTAAKPSITTPGGVSTTIWLPQRSPRKPWKQRSIVPPPMMNGSAITRRLSSIISSRIHPPIRCRMRWLTGRPHRAPLEESIYHV